MSALPTQINWRKEDASTLVGYVIPKQAASQNQESSDLSSGECQNGMSV
ncbi:hypothetical protein H6G97_17845 [Nostoc flagelliforme FACHB-838]|uniref:Uncharacterized protein n=1 Tax=Nostoc flagelliforme FACHB-838 TaxID=2692904 RepID=A0ABR8DPF6_9NOSO|nr:hypothetical protein [Nostoc flagelliforme]MBD2531347.1 hypothetical protein [Nostoc flagelliforme FACHB-838]